MKSHWCVPLLVAAVSACAPAPEGGGDAEPAVDSLPSTIPEVSAAIDEAIGGAAADEASQCRLVALGVRPCGGPRTYRAYSVGETDSTYLAALAAVYAQLDRERNAELGLVSTCEVMTAPALTFESGRCGTNAGP